MRSHPAFSGKLKSLADRGFAGAILQEIAAMGVEAKVGDDVTALATDDEPPSF